MNGRSGSPHLETGEALRHPAAGSQGAEVRRIEPGIPLGEIDDADARLGGEPANCGEKNMRSHSAGPPARSGGKLRAVDHIDVAVDEDRVAVAYVRKGAIDRGRNAVAAHFTHG